MRNLSLALFLSACNANPAPVQSVDVGLDCSPPEPSENMAACEFLPTNYPGGDWPSCSADDDSFHLSGAEMPASAMWTLSVEMIGATTWSQAERPSASDFARAKNQYAPFAESISALRDVHDRMQQPLSIASEIGQAFDEGASGVAPRVQSARLQALFLWSSYLSTLSQLESCETSSLEGCDQAWGWLNGAKPRNEPLGLGRTLRAAAPEGYQHAYDGILAVSCWRDIDRSMPDADHQLYLRAQAQLDRAEIYGLARVARQHLAQMSCSSGDFRAAHFETARTLVGFLDRESRARVPELANVLRTQAARDASTIDVAAAIDAIDRVYPCP